MLQNITVTSSTENFDTWINKEFIPEQLKTQLKKASILLVPTLDFREKGDITFPSATDELLDYIKNNLPEGITADICIDEADYVGLALHSNYKRIGNILVTALALPILATLISNYVYDNYVKHEEQLPMINININNSRHEENNITIIDSPGTQVLNNDEKLHVEKATLKKYMEPAKVEFTITVTDSNKASKEFNYKGLAKDAHISIKEIQQLWENDTTGNQK